MMEHDEILERLSARKRLDIGAEIQRDRAGKKLRRATRPDHSTSLRQLISRSTAPLLRFGRRSPSPLPSSAAEIDPGETVVSPG
jgi:hypothetical protein